MGLPPLSHRQEEHTNTGSSGARSAVEGGEAAQVQVGREAASGLGLGDPPAVAAALSQGEAQRVLGFDGERASGVEIVGEGDGVHARGRLGLGDEDSCADEVALVEVVDIGCWLVVRTQSPRRFQGSRTTSSFIFILSYCYKQCAVLVRKSLILCKKIPSNGQGAGGS